MDKLNHKICTGRERSVCDYCKASEDKIYVLYIHIYIKRVGLPQWLSSKQSTCNAGDTGDAGLIPGSGRSPGGGKGNPLLYWRKWQSTHAYRIPWTEEPGGLQRVRQN